MTRKLPTVSIVIPAYNESESIERCLLTCINQTRRAHEIIVVNNLSTDNTAAIVRRMQKEYKDKANIRLFTQDKAQGITPTRNLGFDRATGEVLGRIDADSIIDASWVREVQQIFNDRDVMAASGPVVYHDMPARRFGARADDQIRNTLDRLARDHKFLFGSNMAIRATAWQDIKDEVCLDEEDLMHEDMDLAMHMFQRDMKIVYDRNMLGGMSARRLDDSPRKFYRYIMRYERTYKRHDIKSASARIPIFIYLSTYFPLKAIRLAYDNDENRISLGLFRKRLAEARANDAEAKEAEQQILLK